MSSESRETRTQLNREALVETALAIGDAEGLEAISLRRVARELGVTPMALYRYVDSKEDLLSGVAERSFDEFELPDESADSDWREQMRFLGRSFRRVLVAHPMVATLYSAHPAKMISPNGAKVVEVVLGVLCRAGFSIGEAALIESECERFILGLAILEIEGAPTNCLGSDPREHARGLEATLAQVDVKDFPHLAAALPYLDQHEDPDRAFELALDLIVGGLERLLESKGEQPEPR
jgi:TetR/AcrR family tetracycline transcriptional repressor